jgi:Sec-independent protein translocase protein TatA
VDAHDKWIKAYNAYQRYLKQAYPAAPPGRNQQIASYLLNLIGTSRVNIGGVSPLLNRLVPGLFRGASSAGGAAGAAAGGAAAGGAAGALAIAGAALIVVAVFKGLAEAAKAAREALTEFQSARWATNATPGELGRASNLAHGMGMSVTEVAGMARQFNDIIAQGGYAQGLANSKGIFSSPNAWDRSTQADMRNFLRAAEYIVSASEKDAIRFAKLTGTESLLGLRDLSPDVQKQVLKSAGDISKEDIRAAADFNAQLGLLRAQFQKLVIAIGAPVLKWASEVVGDLSSALRDLIGGPEGVRSFISTWLEVTPIFAIIKWSVKGLAWLASGLAKAIEWLRKQIADFVRRFNPEWADRIEGKKDAKSATDRNTDAINENTRALNNAREMFGGGQRARSAVPAAWRWQNLDQAMHAQAARMGAL